MIRELCDEWRLFVRFLLVGRVAAVDFDAALNWRRADSHINNVNAFLIRAAYFARL